MAFALRPLRPEDNNAIAQVIRDVMSEYGCVGEGYACNDPEMADLCGYYQQVGGRYLVVDDGNGKVLGGGGIERLKGTTDQDSICELQKFYLLPKARGKGLGSALVERLLAFAREQGFRRAYIETTPQMAAAQTLYRRCGFTPLDAPLGHTGHADNCSVRMIKAL